MKRKKTHLNVWFGLMVWVHPEMTKTASSTTGALLGAVSQQPYILAPYQPKSHRPNSRTRLDTKQGITNTLALPIDKMLYIYLLCPHSEHQNNPFQSKQSKTLSSKKPVHLM
jgi:hypothetical protein